MSIIKQLAKETAIYGISSIFARLLPFVIFTPFYTYTFPTGGYGIVSEVYVWTALMIVLFTYRMETTFFRFGSKNEDFEKSFSTASISIISSTIVFLILWNVFVEEMTLFILKENKHQDLIILLSFIVGFDALSAIPFAKLRLEKRPIRFATIKIANILINIVFVLFFLWLCPKLIEQGYDFLRIIYNPDNRIAYIFWANLIASAFTFLMFIPAYFKIKFQFDWSHWRKMIIYALPLVIVGIAGVINQLSANTLIKEFFSDDFDLNFSKAGIYNGVAKFAVFMNLYTQAFNYAAEPFFFSSAHHKEAKKNYANVARLFALLGVVALLGIWFYIDLIKYFIGRDYREGLLIVPILLFANLFLGLYYNFSIWYKITDQTRYGGYIATAGAIITLVMNIILIPNPRVGYFGPAWAAFTCYLFMASAAYLIGQKKYPVPYPIKRIITYLLLSGGFILTSIYLREVMEVSTPILLGANTFMLILFIGILYRLEGSFLKTLRSNG